MPKTREEIEAMSPEELIEYLRTDDEAREFVKTYCEDYIRSCMGVLKVVDAISPPSHFRLKWSRAKRRWVKVKGHHDYR